MEQPLVNYWWQIFVVADPDLEELIFWRLQKFGFQGSATEPKGEDLLTSAFIPMEKVSDLDLAALSFWLEQDALIAGYRAPLVSWNLIPEQDWSTSWKEHWQPQEVGDSLVIYPAWLEVPIGVKRHVIRLDPGSAFGTGTHATTQLCLEALEMRLSGSLFPEFLFADVGCGSGILSIAARQIGVQINYAVDIDSLAIKATRYNWALNKLPTDRLFLEEGSLEILQRMIPRPIDGFVCNILTEPIIAMIPHFQALLAPNGWGILSGILMEQAPEVLKALESHHWIVATLWQRENWACLTIRRG